MGFFKIDPPGVSCFAVVAADSIGLRGLLIGAQYQGKGYGGTAMAALPAYLAAQYDAARAMLSVDHHNPVARRLHKVYGWIETGAVHDARTGPAPVMQRTL